MRNHMEETVRSLRPLFEAIDFSRDDVYAVMASQLYYIARNSTSLLGLTLIHSNDNLEFQKRCIEHIGEESGHELLLLKDLQRLGYALQPELAATGAIYQPQYYQIVCIDPTAFLGYIFFLEMLAPEFGPYISQRANPKGQSFVKVHTHADDEHIEKADEEFQKLPEAKKKLVLANFEMTASSYRSMLMELEAHQAGLIQKSA